MKKWNWLLAAGLAATLTVGCGDDNNDNNDPMVNVDPNVDPSNDPNNEPNNEQAGNIVEVATEVGSFSTLLGAATTAGLADTLATGGPFTVFAPSDAAFDALGGVPSDADLLANILLHHVVSGEQDSAAVVGAGSFTTLANTSIAIDSDADPITVGGAALSATLDVEASNGIIHVMDEVIIPPTILEAAAATEDLSTLVTAVGASSDGIQSSLAGGGPLTVFAPINSAFAAFDEDDLNALLADQEALDNVLAYHVATGQSLGGEIEDGAVLTMLNGDEVTFSVDGSDVRIIDAAGNTSTVVTTDIRLLNGVVHLIDTVLMPGSTMPNIAETAAAAGDFTTLLDAATATGLDAALASDGPFTVFAPTDAAFTDLGVDLSAVEGDVIANILVHHIVAGSYASGDVVAATSYATLANTSLSVDTDETPIEIGGAELSGTLDITASNGIIHVMNEVIVPPTILDVASATADLSTLVTAVGASSSAVQGALAPSTLTGDAPITVFAPTNDAFAASGLDLGSLSEQQVDGVLSHHAVAGQALSGDLTDGQVITTLNGDITVNIDAGGNISMTDGSGNTANVVATLADIRTLTGVVHVIDAVLLPAP